ncbi:MAG: hypothetical protein KC493_03465 [Bacteriovoracaceae bacterium]|nr:hypothetical protein [Bacteriovoracaceae bacterium]
MTKVDKLRERGQALEDMFFNKEDDNLVAHLKEQKEHHDQELALRSISGITNKSVLDNAIDLGITVETFGALTLIPLLKVAWADHICDIKESKVILKFAQEAGIEESSSGYKLLEIWIDNEINPNLYLAWKSYVEVLKEKLTPIEIKALHDEVIGRAKSVAKASGGFLGIGAVSSEEANVLHELDELLKISEED